MNKQRHFLPFTAFLLAIGSLFPPQTARGGDSLLVLRQPVEWLDLTPYVYFRVDSTGKARWEAMRQLPFEPADSAANWAMFSNFADIALWARVRIKNESADTLRPVIYHFAIAPRAWSVAMTVSQDKAPYTEGSVVFQNEVSKMMRLGQQINIAPGATVCVWTREHYPIFGVRNLRMQDFRLISEERYLKVQQTSLYEFREKFYFESFVIGALAVVFILMLVQFFQMRENLYLIFALYILILLVSEWTRFEHFAFKNNFFVPAPVAYDHQVEIVAMYASYWLYFRFLQYFLKTGRFSAIFKDYMDIAQVITLTLLAINCLFLWIGPDYLSYLFYLIIRLIIEAFGLAVIFFLFRFRTHLANLLAIGALGMSPGLIVSFNAAMGHFQLPQAGFFNDPMVFFHLGILWEIMFFGAALGHKNKIIRDERLAAQKALTANLEAEHALQRRLADAEIKSLRAQMNPHFIFNGLTAIDTLILKKDTAKASYYLIEFANLLREVLQNSRESLIKLSDELAALRKYVAIEQLRFPGRFDFRISVAEGLQQEDIPIPPTILQPFVENAIIHGLIPSQKEGLVLTVSVYARDGFLYCDIEDNGIGREAARKNKSLKRGSKQSLGMKITKERILLAGGAINPENTVIFVNLYDEQGQASGTRATIKIALPED